MTVDRKQRINFYVSVEEARGLKRLADAEGTTMSDFLRQLIRDGARQLKSKLKLRHTRRPKP